MPFLTPSLPNAPKILLTPPTSTLNLEKTLFYRLKEDQLRLLRQSKWGYFLDVEDPKMMLIPASKLLPPCVNIFKSQLCQICKKEPISLRAVQPLRDSYHQDWNGKFYFCKSCAKKVSFLLEVETRMTTELFEQPVKVRFLEDEGLNLGVGAEPRIFDDQKDNFQTTGMEMRGAQGALTI